MVATQGNPRLHRVRPPGVQEPPGRAATPLHPPPGRHPDGADGRPHARRGRRRPGALRPRPQQAQEAGVPLRLLYGVARDIPDAILDMAVTHGADLLLLGTTRRGALWKAMKGDVIQAVAEHLPEQRRAADPRLIPNCPDRLPLVGSAVRTDPSLQPGDRSAQRTLQGASLPGDSV